MAEDTSAAATSVLEKKVTSAESPDTSSVQDGGDAVVKSADASGDATAAKESEKSESATEDKPAESSAPAESEEAADKTEGAAAAVGEGEGEGEGEAPAAEPEAGANGTPAASTKKSNGKRKSTSVPEHKGKKLNRKKSAARITHLDAQPGEHYLARQKGWSAWPSVICDEEMLPQSLLATRPVTTKQLDGTYRPDYADGGKRVHERTFPIMYLHTNEFSWISNTGITPLDTSTCKDISEKGKSKNLLAAYQVAAENHDLQWYKDMLEEHQRALQQDEEEREARVAAKATKQDKKKRKSMDVSDQQEDEEMEEAGEEKRKTTKKRKKDVESEGESDKPIKTPKTATKLKLTTPKTPATGEITGKKAAGGRAAKAKGAAAKKGGKAAASDEETLAEKPKDAGKKAVDMQEAKAQRENQVRWLRHKLQKGFLSDKAPEEDELETMSGYIRKLESYQDLEVSIIRATKINKVLKAIIKLGSIPKDEEFNFRGRAVNILVKWKDVLGKDVPAAVAGPAAGSETPAAESKKKEGSKPAANGVHKQVNGKVEEAAAASPETPADKDVDMPDAPEGSAAGEEEKEEKEEKEKSGSPTSAKEEESSKEAVEATT
ncbi:hypothetical protein AJ80_09018 [Polytolypa hystricis UAMH7299]|uniref:PWWP domain-containing protein n=1 Tax=Polytolypa hystricis (strain UAMH7299) TaxID=1447883 RepID=A0A2B7WY21_POLH7|nr:hypothetical protein AJ80_09018 [Polytolypa hystricis UAMH7299]